MIEITYTLIIVKPTPTIFRGTRDEIIEYIKNDENHEDKHIGKFKKFTTSARHGDACQYELGLMAKIHLI